MFPGFLVALRGTFSSQNWKFRLRFETLSLSPVRKRRWPYPLTLLIHDSILLYLKNLCPGWFPISLCLRKSLFCFVGLSSLSSSRTLSQAWSRNRKKWSPYKIRALARRPGLSSIVPCISHKAPERVFHPLSANKVLAWRAQSHTTILSIIERA